jgi:uncharacterized membrane protein
LFETIETYIEGLGIWTQALMIFALALFPVLDRFAIPAAYAVGLPWQVALPVMVAGNIMPIPFLLLFIRKVFAFLRRFNPFGRWIEKLERHAGEKSDKVRRFQFFGLTLFVAVPIPLPGTGGWTAALIAVVMGTRFKHALLAISIGSVILGLIMTVLTYGLFDGLLVTLGRTAA